MIARRPSTGGAEEILFELPAEQRVSSVPRVSAWTSDDTYDIAKDGRILALVTNEARAVRPLTLVQNWNK